MEHRQANSAVLRLTSHLLLRGGQANGFALARCHSA